MVLNLYNTLHKKIEKFEPIDSKEVRLYTCGPTVYHYAHIGNLRTFIFEDILKRALYLNGFHIKHVMNITDVGHLTSDADSGDDKIEKKAKQDKKTVWEVADFYTEIFKKNLNDLNILSPDIWCKATDHIDEQIELIKRIEKNGYTYKTSDGIYFDTVKFKDYGALANLDIKGLQAGIRIEMKEKKNPTDFALWKFSPKNEKRQMEWASPWGIGFPGWHIECSAMAMKYLGETFDIHCGGVDHINVHHSNEIAQAEAATGKKFVNYWLHGEFLLINDNRMGKSQGNFITLDDLMAKKFNPLAFRYFCLTAHYHSKLNFSEAALQSAQNSLNNLYKTIYNFDDPTDVDTQYLEKFLHVVNDNLNMPQALAIMWDLLKSDMESSKKAATLFEFDKILGLHLAETFNNDEEEKAEIPEEVLELAEQRLRARCEKDWQLSDELRKKINELGYQIDDKKDSYDITKK